MKNPETKFTNKCCDVLKSHGAMVFACVAGEKSSGWPDRFIAHPRWSGWIEFKGVDTPLRENQRLTIEGLNKRGVNAVVVREHKTVDRFFVIENPNWSNQFEISRILDILAEYENTYKR